MLGFLARCPPPGNWQDDKAPEEGEGNLRPRNGKLQLSEVHSLLEASVYEGDQTDFMSFWVLADDVRHVTVSRDTGCFKPFEPGTW